MNENTKDKLKVCVDILLGILLLALCLGWIYSLGYVFDYSGKESTRVSRIQLYNERATVWEYYGKHAFKNQSFTVNGLTMKEGDDSYPLYPVRDQCAKKGDPSEGCKYTESLYYQVNVPVSSSESMNFTVKIGNYTVAEMTGALNPSYYYTNYELGCAENNFIKQYINCYKACKALNGTYWYNGCSVTVYLSHICLRVSQNDSLWMVDYPPKLPLSKNQVGCDKYNGYSPGYYVDYDPHLKSVPVMIRSYQDGYIAASEFADDCDSDGENCFGLSASEFQSRFIFWLVYFVLGICGCVFAVYWKPERCRRRLVKANVDGSGDSDKSTTNNTVNNDIEKQVGEVEKDSLHQKQDELNAVPQEPSTVSSQAPPEVPSSSSPEVPSSASPEVPSSASPQAPSSTSPEVPSSTSPEVPPSSSPEVPPGSSPEVPPSTSPEVPPSASPEVPSSTSPEVPSSSSPEVPSSASPQAPSSTSPEVPSSTSPEVPPSSSPEVPPSTSQVQPRLSLPSSRQPIPLPSASFQNTMIKKSKRDTTTCQ